MKYGYTLFATLELGFVYDLVSPWKNHIHYFYVISLLLFVNFFVVEEQTASRLCYYVIFCILEIIMCAIEVHFPRSIRVVNISQYFCCLMVTRLLKP
jgi:hypothetical protein